MVNALTRKTGLTLGPIILETLVKHYFERVANENAEHAHSTRLRKEELLYDEAFNIIKVSCQFFFYSTSPHARRSPVSLGVGPTTRRDPQRVPSHHPPHPLRRIGGQYLCSSHGDRTVTRTSCG